MNSPRGVQPESLKPECATLRGQRGFADVTKFTDPETGRHYPGGPNLSPLKTEQRTLLPLMSERCSKKGPREVPGGAPPTSHCWAGVPWNHEKGIHFKASRGKNWSLAASQPGTGAQSFSLKELDSANDLSELGRDGAPRTQLAGPHSAV